MQWIRNTATSAPGNSLTSYRGARNDIKRSFSRCDEFLSFKKVSRYLPYRIALYFLGDFSPIGKYNSYQVHILYSPIEENSSWFSFESLLTYAVCSQSRTIIYTLSSPRSWSWHIGNLNPWILFLSLVGPH